MSEAPKRIPLDLEALTVKEIQAWRQRERDRMMAEHLEHLREAWAHMFAGTDNPPTFEDWLGRDYRQ
jgi:hypothetical protein